MDKTMKDDDQYHSDTIALIYDLYHKYLLKKESSISSLNASLALGTEIYDEQVIMDYEIFFKKIQETIKNQNIDLDRILISMCAISQSKIDWSILSEDTLTSLMLSVVEMKDLKEPGSENKAFRLHIMRFLIKLYSSLDYQNVCKICCRYTSSLIALRLSRLTIKDMFIEEDDDEQTLVKLWIKMKKHAVRLYDDPKAKFLHELLEIYWLNPDLEITIHILEFLIVLVSQNETRKFVKYLIIDKIFVKRLKRSDIYLENEQVKNLVESLESYSFINEEAAYTKLTLLKKLAFMHFPEQVSKSSINQQNEIGSLYSITYLEKAMKEVEYNTIATIAKCLRINNDSLDSMFQDEEVKKEIMIELIKDKIDYKNDILNGKSVEYATFLNPCSRTILNYNALNAKDYIYRIYHNNHKELITRIKEQVLNLSNILMPQFDINNRFDGFEGFHKDAGNINYCRISSIKPPAIGTDYPKSVQAEAEIDLSHFTTTIQEGWISIKPGETLVFVKYKNTKNGYQLSTIKLCQVISLVYASKDPERMKEERQDYLLTQKIRISVLFDPIEFWVSKSNLQDMNIDEVYENFHTVLRMDRGTTALKHALDKLKIMNKQKPQTEYAETDDLSFGNEILYSLRFDEEDVGQELYYDSDIDYSLLFPNKQYFDEMFINNVDVPDRLKESIEYKESTTACEKYLTRQQITAVMSSLCKPVTMITGDYGSGKCFTIINTIKLLLSNKKFGRVLLVTKTDNQLDYICEKLDPKYLIRFGGFRGYREADVSQNDRIIKGKDLSPNGQVDRLLKRRLQLLKMIRQFAESIQYDVFEDFSCERATYMYSNYVIPQHDKFKDEIGFDTNLILDAKKIDDWEKYPFKNFVKQLVYPDIEGSIFTTDSQENKRRVISYWEYIRSIFEEVHEYSALEMIRDQKERERYVLCSFSKVVGMTSSFLVINDELNDYNLSYDTIILMHVDKMSELEKFLALNLQNNNNGLKRIILMGKEDQCKVNEVNLSSPNLDQIVRRNPSIHLIPIQGEVNEPVPGADFFQNLEEAQFLHSVYMYIRLMGQQKFTISIITTTHGQVELLRDMVRNNSASWYQKIGNPKVIVHIDDYEGQENEVVLVSLVRESFEDIEKLYQMLSIAITRATKGVYLFGNFEGLFKESVQKHLGLYNLVKSLPQPMPFIVNQNGVNIDIANNKHLVGIINQIL